MEKERNKLKHNLNLIFLTDHELDSLWIERKPSSVGQGGSQLDTVDFPIVI